jgi:predicted TIM-barrel fold metal-dependent hydrolase
MADLDFKLFDADNHYYEATDAFTRHLDANMRRRCIQWVELDKRTRLMVGGRLCRFIPNPTFDPIAKPGSLYDYYRGKTDGDVKRAFGDLDRIADHPEYRDRATRLEVMDEQGVEACFLFPTLGVGMEEALLPDQDAIVAAFHAFNEWVAEEWGFAHEGRLFGAPVISLADPDQAVVELQWALDGDARIVCLRPAPAPTATGNRPPGDPVFDRFWGLAAEAGVTIGYHSGDSGQSYVTRHWGGNETHESFGLTAFYMLATADRPIYETIAALLTGGVLTRHPGLRIATIESGSEWVPTLFKKTAKIYKQQPQHFAEHPHETLRRQLWVSPHFEEDKRVVADLLGVDHILMGSDWPHAEGLPQPSDYLAELNHDGFSAEEVRKVMRDNGLPLTRREPAGV